MIDPQVFGKEWADVVVEVTYGFGRWGWVYDVIRWTLALFTGFLLGMLTRHIIPLQRRLKVRRYWLNEQTLFLYGVIWFSVAVTLALAASSAWVRDLGVIVILAPAGPAVALLVQLFGLQTKLHPLSRADYKLREDGYRHYSVHLSIHIGPLLAGMWGRCRSWITRKASNAPAASRQMSWEFRGQMIAGYPPAMTAAIAQAGPGAMIEVMSPLMVGKQTRLLKLQNHAVAAGANAIIKQDVPVSWVPRNVAWLQFGEPHFPRKGQKSSGIEMTT